MDSVLTKDMILDILYEHLIRKDTDMDSNSQLILMSPNQKTSLNTDTFSFDDARSDGINAQAKKMLESYRVPLQGISLRTNSLV